VLLATGLICALVLPQHARTQTARHIRRIGLLYTGSRESALDTGRYAAFIEAMRALGYVQGRDFTLEERFADGKPDRFPDLANELVQSRVEVILASGAPAVRALRKVSTAVPIVVAVGFDPVREGYAASLAHPGGNVTGLSALLEDIFPKHVELLKDAIPGLARIAVLTTPGYAEHPPVYKRIETIAGKLGMHVLEVGARESADIEPAVASAVRQRAQALIILGNAIFVQHFGDISALAMKHRLATIYSGRELPQAGGLMSYGPNFQDNYRRAASFVDRILKGANPADLPFEQPTRLELVLNLRTAKAIGLAIPKKLQLQADTLIE
jgi:putative ABC transport system substrate-binding protein